MTDIRKISLLAGAAALAALAASAAAAQTPDTRIEVIGAINAPAHIQPVTDGRDDAAPEIPVVYERQTQNAPDQAQAAPPPSRNFDRTRAERASTDRTNLGQTVKSQ